MNRTISLLLLLLTAATGLNAQSADRYFIENKGQWPLQAKYLSRQRGMNAWITEKGIIYDFYRLEYKQNSDTIQAGKFNSPEISHITGQVVQMEFVHNNNLPTQNIHSRGIDKLTGYFNYFTGRRNALYGRWNSG